MTRKSSYLNPFALWTDLAMQTTGMMLASAEVISHRTARMTQASIPLSARDTAEFTLMGQEKMEAATESMQAAAMSIMAFSPFAAMKMFNEMAAVQTSLFRLATSSSLPAAISRHQTLGHSIRKAANSALSLSDQTANAAIDTLKPIHSRATANAKRLGRRK
ncbi:polyhydroxyalkanoate granule-associated phasin [Asticcacaulis taihuensis]|uniref:polyhydroxyalkanoate granule-associated phasin n=1 Tax=Asticcacaulis taihuensis TaxID=260084 RepID=UPI003F7C6D6E